MFAWNIKFDRFKSRFFDRDSRLLRAIDDATRRNLSRAGAFVRRTAWTSIRRAKSTAAPGRPPHSHVGVLKHNIFFAYEPGHRSVVIGPAALNGRGYDGRIPRVLEEGGVSRAFVRWRHGKGGRGRQEVTRKVYIRPHPYMAPAYRKNKPKIAQIWANSVK